MTKADLLSRISEKIQNELKDSNLTKKETAVIVDAVFDVLSEVIRESDRFSYPKFGTFTVKERGERNGRNPKTHETIVIPASRNVTFKAASVLKEALNVKPEAAKEEVKKEAKKEVKEAKDTKKASKKTTKK